MWLLLVLLGAVCLLLAGYLAALLREMRRMADSLDAIAGGDTNAELYPLVGNRRFRELAAGINRILAVQRERERRLLQADQAFKESVTGISHDLRTPLTSVSGYLQMLQDQRTPPGKRREYWSIVERRLASLLALLDELFEYTRLETGQMSLQPEVLRLERLLPEQLAQYYDAIAAQGLQPEISICPQPVSIFADPKAVERILQNLIKNALVHGRERLRISLSVEEGMALLRFANGADRLTVEPGRLFERFYTADRSRGSGSTGLGLAIVKQLTESMGGGVDADWRDGLLEITVHIPLSRELPGKSEGC